MPPFPKPTIRYSYDLDVERRRLRAHRDRRGVPKKSSRSLLIGSWNIANFGLQERRNSDLQLMATMLKWFDVVALQETRENFADLYAVLHEMGRRYRVVMSDPGGNGERMVFVWDDRKVELLDEVGEITVEPSMARYIKLEGVEGIEFTGFDRPPYLANFRLRGTSFSIQLVNVHLYFGSDGQEDRNRRALEVAALARWADLRSKSVYSGARELIVLGDFNMPKARRDGSNVVQEALVSRGLRTPEHSTIIGSSIATDNQYDQVALMPGSQARWTCRWGCSTSMRWCSGSCGSGEIRSSTTRMSGTT